MMDVLLYAKFFTVWYEIYMEHLDLYASCKCPKVVSSKLMKVLEFFIFIKSRGTPKT